MPPGIGHWNKRIRLWGWQGPYRNDLTRAKLGLRFRLWLQVQGSPLQFPVMWLTLAGSSKFQGTGEAQGQYFGLGKWLPREVCLARPPKKPANSSSSSWTVVLRFSQWGLGRRNWDQFARQYGRCFCSHPSSPSSWSPWSRSIAKGLGEMTSVTAMVSSL